MAGLETRQVSGAILSRAAAGRTPRWLPTCFLSRIDPSLSTGASRSFTGSRWDSQPHFISRVDQVPHRCFWCSPYCHVVRRISPRATLPQPLLALPARRNRPQALLLASVPSAPRLGRPVHTAHPRRMPPQTWQAPGTLPRPCLRPASRYPRDRRLSQAHSVPPTRLVPHPRMPARSRPRRLCRRAVSRFNLRQPLPLPTAPPQRLRSPTLSHASPSSRASDSNFR